MDNVKLVAWKIEQRKSKRDGKREERGKDEDSLLKKNLLHDIYPFDLKLLLHLKAYDIDLTFN